jgi:hypothetical protein
MLNWLVSIKGPLYLNAWRDSLSHVNNNHFSVLFLYAHFLQFSFYDNKLLPVSSFEYWLLINYIFFFNILGVVVSCLA